MPIRPAMRATSACSWRSSGFVGAVKIACGALMFGSTRLRMLIANAAVLPVPVCDWKIRFSAGLRSSSGSAEPWIFDGCGAQEFEFNYGG